MLELRLPVTYYALIDRAVFWSLFRQKFPFIETGDRIFFFDAVPALAISHFLFVGLLPPFPKVPLSPLFGLGIFQKNISIPFHLRGRFFLFLLGASYAVPTSPLANFSSIRFQHGLRLSRRCGTVPFLRQYLRSL